MNNSLQPVIGFGLDAKYTHKYPNGIGGLCNNYRDKLSHLSIVGLYGKELATYFKENCAVSLPIVHHLSNIEPASHSGPSLQRLEILEEITQLLDAVWLCEDIGLWSIGPYEIPYFAPPIFELEAADQIVKGIEVIQEKTSAPFLAEIPSCSFVAGKVGLGEFFTHIIRNSGCKMLLDVSHVYSYSIFTGTPILDVLKSLPLDDVWEIHIAGGRVNSKYNYRYVDTHSHAIIDEVMDLFIQSVKDCKNLKCITYEIGMNLPEELLISEVSRIESKLREINWTPKIKKSKFMVSEKTI